MDILAKIIVQKRIEIVQTRHDAQQQDWASRVRDLPPPRDFTAALRAPGRMRVIAEIKKASPSAGVLRPEFDPAAIARSYAAHGADALSILTDRNFFQGSLDDLRAGQQASGLPVLRKDFVIDESQILEARLAGASACLLIAECLAPDRLGELVAYIHEQAMSALVELHDAENLAAVLASGTRLVGINNRNLRTFQTTLDHTLDLVTSIPPDRVIVSESGIRTREDVERLNAAGVGAILVGETFMRAEEPGAKLAELLGIA